MCFPNMLFESMNIIVNFSLTLVKIFWFLCDEKKYYIYFQFCCMLLPQKSIQGFHGSILSSQQLLGKLVTNLPGELQAK